jgi:hypothetical protein
MGSGLVSVALLLSMTAISRTEEPAKAKDDERSVKRFELVDKEKCELRLLPQPIDRYTPSSADRADGAIFLLAFGTNPEVALFIESDGTAWNYAAGRLSGACQIRLTIDGVTAWEGAPVNYGSNQPYNASNAAADIPGIAKDGSEIEE